MERFEVHNPCNLKAAPILTILNTNANRDSARLALWIVSANARGLMRTKLWCKQMFQPSTAQPKCSTRRIWTRTVCCMTLVRLKWYFYRRCICAHHHSLSLSIHAHCTARRCELIIGTVALNVLSISHLLSLRRVVNKYFLLRPMEYSHALPDTTPSIQAA